MKPGVKPAVIDSLGAIAVKKNLSPCQLDELKIIEYQFTEKLLAGEPKSFYEIVPVSNFAWKPVLKYHFIKTDIINKVAERCELSKPNDSKSDNH